MLSNDTSLTEAVSLAKEMKLSALKITATVQPVVKSAASGVAGAGTLDSRKSLLPRDAGTTAAATEPPLSVRDAFVPIAPEPLSQATTTAAGPGQGPAPGSGAAVASVAAASTTVPVDARAADQSSKGAAEIPHPSSDMAPSVGGDAVSKDFGGVSREAVIIGALGLCTILVVGVLGFLRSKKR